MRNPGFGVRVVDAEHPLGDGGDELRIEVLHTIAEHQLGRAAQLAVVAEHERVARAGARSRRDPPADVSPAASAAVAASPAYIPLAIAKLTPSSQMPAARHSAAASPATSIPSVVSLGIIDRPASGIRCAEYSFSSPPSTSGAIAECAFILAMISSGRSVCAASVGSFSTTPTAIVSRFV